MVLPRQGGQDENAVRVFRHHPHPHDNYIEIKHDPKYFIAAFKGVAASGRVSTQAGT